MSSVTTEFTSLLEELESDRDLSEKIREQTKEVDRVAREASTVLNLAHSTPAAQISAIVQKNALLFQQARQTIRQLVDLVPANQYYKWNDLWSMTIQRITFSIALTYYLGTGRLMTKEQIGKTLDVRDEEYDRFHLATEEYLHSLVSMINELSRLAVNSVTLGDFGTPLRLSVFVKELHAGFQLLNLKNDSLRKRFDSIKYDVKKIEEVVYDIALRGLNTSAQPGVGSVSDDLEAEKVLQLLEGKAS